MGVSFLVESVQVRFVIGDPFLDGHPRRLDGLHGLDIEGGTIGPAPEE
jgi:hypothetical protein